MKKIVALLLIAVMAFSFLSCGKKEKTGEKQPFGKTTLMIYMVGSDLEAKSANATKDLEEMASSGIDLANSNLIVYAGGTPKWHNEFVTQQEHNVLKLGENGFEKVKSMSESSMGEAAALTDFLDYAYKTYPADEYALILWNHGNGPVIGYGKDIVYENDSLTLKEMQSALEASPFSSDNKLKWVGFDACLMASAELACVFDDYAEYLVASQEVEPHFGWDYSFLSELTTTRSPEILKNITEGYYSACEEYFEDKGYSGRETTLSVMDLSKAAAVETAINSLFSKVTPDVPVEYNSLASKRVDTRALGRASTGSEYDLIDLNDMAEKLSELYPEETKELKAAISGMVIKNKTNTEGLCGVSIYYPFYNKKRYQSEWSTAYEELNMFADYRSYLQAYSQIWLKDDFLANASSVMPSMSAQGVYNLELTPEQEETFAEAQFIILQRAGEDLYTPLFINGNVKKTGNTLSTNFDGNVIYAKDKFNNYCIPVCEENETVGDVSHYSLTVGVGTPKSMQLQFQYEDSQNDKMMFHFAVNNATKKIDISALMPYDDEIDAEELMGGKTPEPDLSKYAEYNFVGAGHYLITRYDNGAVRPIKEWEQNAYYYANVLAIADDVEFVFAPLVTGEYYFIYQVKDTQGNQYCSDIMPINVQGELPKPIVADPVSVDWTSGDSVSLGEFSGVDVSIKLIDFGKGGNRYAFVCHNKNDFAVDFVATDMTLNDNVFCGEFYSCYLGELNTETFKYDDPFIGPGETVIIDENGMDFGDAENSGKLTDISSMDFVFSIVRADDIKTLVNKQPVRVNIAADHNLTFGGQGWGVPYYDFPARGLFSSEHQIYDDGMIKASVVALGNGSKVPDEWGFVDTAEDCADGPINIMFAFENAGTASQWVQVQAIVFDGIAVPAKSKNTNTLPGCTSYANVHISEDDLDIYGITSASNVEVVFRKAAFESISGAGGFSKYFRAPIKLSQSGAPAKFKDTGLVLLNENGVKISLVSFISDDYSTTWWLAVTNSSSNDYSVGLAESLYNGKKYSNINDQFAAMDNLVFAGEKTYVEVCMFIDETKTQSLTSKIAFMDVAQEKILAVSDTQIQWFADGKPLQ